jgi:cell division protein FtsB
MGSYKCSGCDYTAATKERIEIHINKKTKCSEGLLTVQTIDFSVNCQYCDKKYNTISGLKRHESECQKKSKDKRIKSLENEVDKLKKEIKDFKKTKDTVNNIGPVITGNVDTVTSNVTNNNNNVTNNNNNVTNNNTINITINLSDHSFKIEEFSKKQIMYLIYVLDSSNLTPVFKFGKTSNIDTRLQQIKSSLKKNLVPIKCWDCVFAEVAGHAETRFKYYVNYKDIAYSKYGSTEMFHSNNIELIISEIDNLVLDCYNKFVKSKGINI